MGELRTMGGIDDGGWVGGEGGGTLITIAITVG